MPETPTTPVPVAADHLCFPHTPGSAPPARRWARRQVADGWGVPEAVADDVALVVGELAGNVLKHVPRIVRGCAREFHVRLELLTPDTVRVEVHDAADSKPLRVASAGYDDEGGRGLLLVQVLAGENWGVCPRAPFGKIVWANVGPPPAAT
jgi:anti-sigma regulatory factor (Ser/Thr protein kinase)